MPRTEMTAPPSLLWLRRDLRLADHPGWALAVSLDRPVIPVFILDPVIERSYGAAPRWRLGKSLKDLSSRLHALGSRLILRRGPALDTLRDLAAQTGADTVIWSRLYEPSTIARDTAIKSALEHDGLDVRSVNSSLLFEPWEAATKSGTPFRVYSPFWRDVCDRTVHSPIAAPAQLPAPNAWPASDPLERWDMGAAMRRGASVVEKHAGIGEEAALARLDRFAKETLPDYEKRDFLALDVCSRLSENLACGEIGPRQIWTVIQRVRERAPQPAQKFLKELVWREFAYHLMYHTPALVEGNWRPEWDDFPWRGNNSDAEAWRRGQTGVDIVDAAMREMYVTGTMHNRARMLTASFLTKHLMTDWRVGADWFAECLIDWDPASNAMGWQWVAGSGPDAAPYFRIFNPELQAGKFDPDGAYRDRFLPWRGNTVHAGASDYVCAVPRSWNIGSNEGRPTPVVGMREGRERALDAYRAHKKRNEKEQEDA